MRHAFCLSIEKGTWHWALAVLLRASLGQYDFDGAYTLKYGFHVGAEYLYGTRRNIDGSHGSASMVEAMVKYSF